MRTGFSLIEMSVVLLILSILLGGGLNVGQSIVRQQAYDHTDERLADVREALLFFYQNHRRLPCPAQPNVILGNAAYGQEIIWDGSGDSCANDTSVPSGTTRTQTASGSGIWVRSGALPTRTLGLPDAMMADAFNNRFTYVVMEDLTDNVTFHDPASTANIIINDGTGVQVGNNIAFALISHGSDGKGAYRYRSGAQIACGSGVRDAENCDGDITYTDTPFNDSSFSSNFFDDRIAWMNKQMIIDTVLGRARFDFAPSWAGLTSSTYDGDVGGISDADALCESDYADSRMLRANDFAYFSAQEYANIVAGITATAAEGNSGAAWFTFANPILPPGLNWFTQAGLSNCFGYTNDSSASTGAILGRSGSGNGLHSIMARCHTPHRIACVYN